MVGFTDFSLLLPMLLLPSGAIQYTYCALGREEINTWRVRGAAARVSVTFRKFSPCIACARRARVRV
jgi:hypothetical protein